MFNTVKEFTTLFLVIGFAIWLAVTVIFGIIIPGATQTALVSCESTGNVDSSECIHAEKLGMSAKRLLADSQYRSDINAISIMKIITNHKIIINAINLFIESNTGWQEQLIADAIKEFVEKDN